ncbi:MAG: PfaD family polyunsaturated fatty acid/polyketide biosynthesis protein [Anaerolineae bacterium]|nr:PfaD family polyunsaturated fatty acid/polyketide biosynthesis protein [Anaerolineae bacterium]
MTQANKLFEGLSWQGKAGTLAFDTVGQRARLLALDEPLYAVEEDGRTGLANKGRLTAGGGARLLGLAPALPFEALGNAGFRQTYGARAAFYAGAMANAIASEELVIALGKAGLMGSFGAGGCSPARVAAAVAKVQAALPQGPYAFNLLNNPNDPALELKAAELYVQHGVPVVEASAYLDISYAVAYYRLTGLSANPDGSARIGHRLIAKLSRKEVAARFLAPAPAELVALLLDDGRITPEQAALAKLVPMADDITAEADSGGHTDNRPLVCLLPAITALRDEMQRQHNYPQAVRVGAAGGIGTPQAALAAFTLGAAYVVTGSINQACVEAGTSDHTRGLLAQADMADVAMAPAADMFEMGVRVQVLKRGTMFAPRASKLYELYSRYNAWQEVPAAERERLEKTVFKRTYEEIWQDTAAFFAERDPAQLARGTSDPRQQMALVFRWYLGLSSRWSNTGEAGREMDYQIWCGAAMGAFNDWVRGTYLEASAQRRVVDVSLHLLTGTAYLARLQTLAQQGVRLPDELGVYKPESPLA